MVAALKVHTFDSMCIREHSSHDPVAPHHVRVLLEHESAGTLVDDINQFEHFLGSFLGVLRAFCLHQQASQESTLGAKLLGEVSATHLVKEFGTLLLIALRGLLRNDLRGFIHIVTHDGTEVAESDEEANRDAEEDEKKNSEPFHRDSLSMSKQTT